MKLNVKQTILVGLAFLSICTFWQMYDNEIPLILENSFGLRASVIGVIMALDNVLAVFLLPVFGTLSDRVNTRMGKRTPFILGGTAAAVILLILLSAANDSRSLPLFITCLLLLLLAMSTYRSPAVALMPDVTPAPLRSKANAIINLMGTVGAIFALVFIPLLGPKESGGSYLPLFAAIAGVMAAALVILLLTVRENPMREARERTDAEYREKEEAQGASREDAGREASCRQEHSETETAPGLAPDVRRSMYFLLASVAFWFFAYNAVTTAFSRYYQNYWNLADRGYTRCLMVATVTAVFAYIPAGSLASRFGRKKTILGGVLLLAASFLMACFFRNYTFSINLVFMTVGIGWATINVNSYPMVVEMSAGSDIGKFTGFYYTASMSAQIVTPILSGILIDHLGYQVLFPYAVIFSALAFLTMCQVKHGDSRPVPPQSKLEQLGGGED